MRASWLVALLAGCHAPTSVDVVVRFNDAAVHPDRLDATITVGNQQPLRMAAPVRAEGRTIRDGDDFVVLLPDSAAGQPVAVAVDAVVGNQAVLHGSGVTTAALHREVMLPIDLGGVFVPDMSIVDMTVPPDLTPCTVGTTTCAGGVESTCLADGGMATRPCVFGCGGNACATADDCAAAGSVGMGGSFAGDSAMLKDDTAASCSATPGPDLVTSLVLTDWRTVTVDSAGSAFDTVVSTRTACADVASELPLAGPCPGAATDPLARACSANAMASSLVLCGLPPGTYFNWLDAAGAGGAWKLSVTATPVDLNSCAGAGALLGPGTWGPVDTANHANNLTTASMKCTGTGAGPEAVFYLVVPTARSYTFTTQKGFRHLLYVRPGCGDPDLDCVETTQPSKGVTLTLALNPGVYFVVVDGQTANDTGQVRLTVN